MESTDCSTSLATSFVVVEMPLPCSSAWSSFIPPHIGQTAVIGRICDFVTGTIMFVREGGQTYLQSIRHLSSRDLSGSQAYYLPASSEFQCEIWIYFKAFLDSSEPVHSHRFLRGTSSIQCLDLKLTCLFFRETLISGTISQREKDLA